MPRREAERQAAGRAQDDDVVADAADPGRAQALGLGGRRVHVVDVEVEVDAARPVGDRLHLEPRVTAGGQERGELVVARRGWATGATR